MPVATPPQDATAATEEQDASEESTRRGPRRIAKPESLEAAIKEVMRRRGLSTRDVVKRVDQRHIGTVYRLLAGRTTDPWASTVVSLCNALACDPDELLGVEDALAILDPDIRNTLSDINRLAEEDRWLALDMLRSILERRLHGLRGPKKGTDSDYSGSD